MKVDRPADDNHCSKSYSRFSAKRGVRAVMRSPRLTRARGAHAWRFVRCTRTRRSERLVRHELLRLRAWRRSYTGRWLLAWRRLPPWGQSWTRRVSFLESGNRRYAPESGYLSFFQWRLSTWVAACGCSMSPYAASWHHQATVAWNWHLSHPTGQWPNTGE